MAEVAIEVRGADRDGRADGRWSVRGTTVAAGLVAGCVAVALAALIPSRSVAGAGIQDAGPFVESGLSALKAVFDFAAALTVGWLVGAFALAPPRASGGFDVGGFRAVRAASLCAAVWAAASFALIPVSLADKGGSTLAAAARANNLEFGVAEFDDIRGYLISGTLALLIALAGRLIMKPAGAAGLLAVALIGLVPLALAGHASAEGDHDLAVDSMIFHLVGVSLWVGGLVAFPGLARQRSPHLAVTARRYSALALVAFVVVAASGVVNAWIRLARVSDLWTYDYGRLLLLKTVLLVGLGLAGFAHRRRTLPALVAGRRGPLMRLAAVEILVMAVTIGVAAVLGRTAPPAGSAVIPPDVERILGFDVPGPFTVGRLFDSWRFDLIFGTLALVLAATYTAGVLRLRRRGDQWPVSRSVAWLLGCLTLLVISSSGLGRWSQAQFSWHMVTHMLYGMVIPILLVLGAPTTLALRALPARRDGVPGAREALVAALQGRTARILTHPLVVLPLFVGSFYAVYFTGLFALMVSTHLGHIVMSAHFMLVGYLYYWVIIGLDPAPRQLSPFVKLALLLLAMPFHAFFGLALMTSKAPLAADFYTSLHLSWVPDLVADQQLGGGVAWGLTEIPLLIVLIALMSQWAKADDRQSRREDRRADQGDDELDAYNRMLAGLAARPVERADRA